MTLTRLQLKAMFHRQSNKRPNWDEIVKEYEINRFNESMRYKKFSGNGNSGEFKTENGIKYEWNLIHQVWIPEDDE